MYGFACESRQHDFNYLFRKNKTTLSSTSGRNIKNELVPNASHCQNFGTRDFIVSLKYLARFLICDWLKKYAKYDVVM